MTGIVGASNYGLASSASVSLTDQDILEGIRGLATATYTITNTGTVQDQDATILEAWLNGTGGNVANYEVRATVQYGALSSGTVGSWLSCSSSRSWSVSNGARDNSDVTVIFLVEIRLASSGVVQDSATIQLDAISYSFGPGG